MIKEIDTGRKEDKGNAECPQCGKRVLIDDHWGDLPKCDDCNMPYAIIYPPTQWES